MKKKFQIAAKAARMILVCCLCSCGNRQNSLDDNYQNIPDESTTKEVLVQENISESITENIIGQEIADQILEEIITEVTTTEAETTAIRIELVEKWNTCWADGEFTYEETETILQAAGYFENEYGIYQDNKGNGIDYGIAYELIRDGYVFKQQENGSFVLISALKAEFGDYDVHMIDSLICSYGYEIEYNNDKAYVYDGNGNFYSYEEFTRLLLNGEEIPYAPKAVVQNDNSYIYNQYAETLYYEFGLDINSCLMYEKEGALALYNNDPDEMIGLIEVESISDYSEYGGMIAPTLYEVFLSEFPSTHYSNYDNFATYRTLYNEENIFFYQYCIYTKWNANLYTFVFAHYKDSYITEDYYNYLKDSLGEYGGDMVSYSDLLKLLHVTS